MKENTFISTGGGKASENLITLIKNVKKSAFDGRLIKAALIALLIAGAVAKAGAEEVTGTILFPADIGSTYAEGLHADYGLDTNGDFIMDKVMRSLLVTSLGSTDMSAYGKLLNYLKEGNIVIYENEELHYNTFKRDRLISIILANGIKIELTQLFSIEEIKREFPYLYKKLQRQVGDR
jgi:hypothetical protein